MIIYNVTFSVDKEVAEEWLSWMKDKHIPKVIAEGLFDSHKFLKILSHEDDNTFSYAVQFFSESFEGAEKYHNDGDVFERYGERVLSYPTLLKEV